MKYAIVKGYVAGCRRLSFNLLNSKISPSPTLLSLFAMGRDVDGLAVKTILSHGTTLTAKADAEADYQATKVLLEEGTSVINQATFKINGSYIRVDSIDMAKKKLSEVKAGSKVKPDYVVDLAFQETQLRKVGIVNNQFSVIHRNPDFVTGDNWNGALLESDVTSQVNDLLENENFNQFLRHFESNPDTVPEPTLTKNCKKCEFRHECWSGIENPSIEIPNMSNKLVNKLVELEAYSLESIPDEILTPKQLCFKNQIIGQEVRIAESDLLADLQMLKFPAGHLDFEAFNLPYHPSPNIRTCAMVPFQASIHVEHSNGSIEHFEYLCDHEVDDRYSLAVFLVKNLSKVATVVAWNVSFERRMLSHLAAEYRSLSEGLHEIIEKLVDLQPLVKNHVEHYLFRGSFGLKSVAPALSPDFSYENLVVDNGNDANGSFQLMVRGMLPSNQILQTRNQLLAYCKNDTAATLAIHRALRKITEVEL